MRVNLLARDYFSEWWVFAAARAKGRLSLVKERGRVRFDSHIPTIGLASRLHRIPLIARGEATKHSGFARFRSYAAGPRPNILWLHPIRTPSNCVIFRL